MEQVSGTFTAALWLYHGAKASWHFITLPEDLSAQIRLFCGVGKRRGWNSVRVRVQIGNSVWTTSIFPDTKLNAYLLPIKAEIRTREDLHPGQETNITLATI